MCGAASMLGTRHILLNSNLSKIGGIRRLTPFLSPSSIDNRGEGGKVVGGKPILIRSRRRTVEMTEGQKQIPIDMNTENNETNTSKNNDPSSMDRRGMLKMIGAAAAGMAAGTVPTAKAAEPQPGADQPTNPYGGGPSTGLQFPPYYKPTPS